MMESRYAICISEPELVVQQCLMESRYVICISEPELVVQQCLMESSYVICISEPELVVHQCHRFSIISIISLKTIDNKSSATIVSSLLTTHHINLYYKSPINSDLK